MRPCISLHKLRKGREILLYELSSKVSLSAFVVLTKGVIVCEETTYECLLEEENLAFDVLGSEICPKDWDFGRVFKLFLSVM